MKEIERKFLVEDISELNLETYAKKHIIQHYLYSDKFTVVRKRKIEENDKKIFYYTIKHRINKYTAEEKENEITEEEYENIKINKDANVIDKVRYIIPIENGLKIELDVFKGIFEGIIFAEVEFKSEEQAINFKITDWFGKELTGKISNNMMTKLSKEEIIEKIDSI